MNQAHHRRFVHVDPFAHAGQILFNDTPRACPMTDDNQHSRGAEKTELRGLAPSDLVKALDAIAMAKGMDRNTYIVGVLEKHVADYLVGTQCRDHGHAGQSVGAGTHEECSAMLSRPPWPFPVRTILTPPEPKPVPAAAVRTTWRPPMRDNVNHRFSPPLRNAADAAKTARIKGKAL